MNNKKYICLFFLTKLMFPIDADQCRDYFNEIKKDAPYQDSEAHIAFAKIFTRETEIAENPFVDELIKKEARRKALCASTFIHYAAYCTSQIKFTKFKEEFNKIRILKPQISHEEYLNTYLQETKARITDPVMQMLRNDLKELEDMKRDAKNSAYSIMALPEEKETSKEWLSVIDKALDNLASTKNAELSSDSITDVKKYIK